MVGAALARTVVLAFMDSRGHSAREVRGGRSLGNLCFQSSFCNVITMSECVFAVLWELFQ